MGEFIIEANKYVHLVTPDSIILNLPELTAIEDRIMTVIVVDKSLNKIAKSAKLGVNTQQIVKGKDFPMWGNFITNSWRLYSSDKEGPTK